MEYTYSNIENKPDLLTNDEEDNMLSGIHYDIINSEMINKNIDYCLWNENDENLHIFYNNELSQDDKMILDDIVNNNTD